MQAFLKRCSGAASLAGRCPAAAQEEVCSGYNWQTGEEEEAAEEEEEEEEE